MRSVCRLSRVNLAFFLGVSIGLIPAPSKAEVSCNDPFFITDIAFSPLTKWLSSNREGVMISDKAEFSPAYQAELIKLDGNGRISQSFTLTKNAAKSLRNILEKQSDQSVPYLVRKVPDLAAGATNMVLGFFLGWGKDSVEDGLELRRQRAAVLANVTTEGSRLLLVHSLRRDLSTGQLLLVEQILHESAVNGKTQLASMSICTYSVAEAPVVPALQ
ncbi:hypothetical protein [Shinella sp. M27]|uniref:hypothetical protein n=1 Tax=Shinella sp. M27 TaxID=3368614 RepID=UPI003B9EE81D